MTDVDGPDTVDIFGDEPGTFVTKDAEATVSKLWLDASLWHSVLRYFGSSLLAAHDVGE